MGFGRKVRRKQQDSRAKFTRESLTAGIRQAAHEISQALKKGTSLTAVTDVARRKLTLLVDDASRLDAPACKKGCSWCCRGVRVTASPWELLALASWLRESRDAKALADLSQVIQEHAEATYTVSAAALAEAKTPCPLLDLTNDSCTVHAARPWACMAHLASDVGSCKEAHEHPDRGVEKNLFGALALGLVHTGFVEASAELQLVHQEVELIQGLHVALATPDAEARWLAGEDVFASARRPVDDEDDVNIEQDAVASLNAVLDDH